MVRRDKVALLRRRSRRPIGRDEMVVRSPLLNLQAILDPADGILQRRECGERRMRPVAGTNRFSPRLLDHHLTSERACKVAEAHQKTKSDGSNADDRAEIRPR